MDEPLDLSTIVWICEKHPELDWPHDDCPGPGMPHTNRISGLVYQRDQARQALSDREAECERLRSLIRLQETEPPFDVADDQTTELAVKLAEAKMALALELNDGDPNPVLAEAKELLGAAEAAMSEAADLRQRLAAAERDAVNAFIEKVERLAEQKMLKTGKLEGAHYAAMKELQKALAAMGPGEGKS